MADPQRSTSTIDVPVEVTMVDGSKWIVHYRLGTDHGGYAHALEWVRRDIDDGRLTPAADPDGVQRDVAQVNMAFVVSVRRPEADHG